MTELEEWYKNNRQQMEKKGIELSVPPEKPIRYLDGQYGRYMFRFIDRDDLIPDVEIMDAVSGESIDHNLVRPHSGYHSFYDAALDFISDLALR